jgi:hypothetical protein
MDVAAVNSYTHSINLSLENEINSLKENAKRGDPNAQYELSLRYFDGNGVPKMMK